MREEDIKSYTENKKYYINHAPNIIKEYILRKDEVFKKGEKLLIYTNLNKTSKKYKDLFTKYGVKAEWLCSKNAKEKDSNEKVMSKSQFSLRTQLLEGDEEIKRGILPDDLDVLIVNAAYETGWNLYDNRIQHVIIDDKKISTQIQARNRVRHDIEELYVTSNYVEDILYENLYVEPIVHHIYKCIIDYGDTIYIPNLAFYLDEKYVDISLNKELKKEMIEKYSTKKCNKESNEFTFSSLKEDIEKFPYKVYASKNDRTYVFNGNKLKDYLIENNKKYSDESCEEYIKFLNKKDDDILNKQELYDYLDSKVGVLLFKEEQSELKEQFMRNGLKSKTLGFNTLTGYCKDEELPFEITNNDGKRIKKSGKLYTVWKIIKRIG